MSVHCTDEEHWGCPSWEVGLHPSLIALVHTWSSLHPPLPRKQEGRQKLPPVVLTVRQRELEGQVRLVSGEQAPVSVQMYMKKILAIRVLPHVKYYHVPYTSSRCVHINAWKMELYNLHVQCKYCQSIHALLQIHDMVYEYLIKSTLMNRLSIAFLKGQTLYNNTTHQEHMTCTFRQLLWVNITLSNIQCATSLRVQSTIGNDIFSDPSIFMLLMAYCC